MAMLTATASFAADSLRVDWYGSAAINNPRELKRPPSNVSVGTDSIENPFDYDLQTGIRATCKIFGGVIDQQYQRQNGLEYWNQEYSGRITPRCFEVGFRMRHSEISGLYLANGYFEAKIYGWVGVGVTRQYTTKWFGDGATMARFSLARDHFRFMPLDVTVRAEYEVNPDRNRFFSYVDLKNIRFRRFAVVPYLKYERINTKKEDVKESYQAKVRLDITI